VFIIAATNTSGLQQLHGKPMDLPGENVMNLQQLKKMLH